MATAFLTCKDHTHAIQYRPPPPSAPLTPPHPTPPTPPHPTRRYVDGVWKASVETSLPIHTAGGLNSSLSIGGSAVAGTGGLNGLISDVRVWAREVADWEAVELSQPLLPNFPNTFMTPAQATVGVSLYTISCAAGYAQAGPSYSWARSAVDNSWAQTGPATGPACTACAPGSSSVPGAAVCTPCPAGSWAAGSGNAACSTCAGGTFSTATTGTGATAAACSSCPAGTYSPGGAVGACVTCPAGTFSAGGAASCTPCAPGTAAAAGSASCTACAGASFSFGGASCAGCATGGALGAATFGSAAGGCAPAAPALASGAAPVFFFAGAQSEAGAFAPTAPAGLAAATGPFGDAGGALGVTAGSALATAPLTVLPTGAASRTITANVRCAAPTSPAGRAILDFWDGSAFANTTEHTTLLGVGGSAGVAIASESYATVTLSGTGGAGGYADGASSSALFNSPAQVTVDPRGIIGGYGAGWVYLADSANHRIRGVDPTGVLGTWTVAGGSNYQGTFPGDWDDVGFYAMFRNPTGLVVDPWSVNLFVGDTGNNAIRAISLDSYTVTTFAGCVPLLWTQSCPAGWVDGLGTAAQFSAPTFVAFDAATGVLYVAENVGRIRAVTQAGAVSTLAGGGGGVAGATAGYADGVGTAALFASPRGLAVVSGVLYVADFLNNRIRAIAIATKVVTTLAGSGLAATVDGAGLFASILRPVGIAADAVGALYVTDSGGGAIRKISGANAYVETIAGVGTGACACEQDGAATAAAFWGPAGVALDSSGGVLVTDGLGNKLRRLTPPDRAASTFSVPVCDTFWHSVAVVVNTTTPGAFSAAVYVDGVVAPAPSARVSLNTANGAAAVALSIGGAAGGVEPFAGAVANVRVYTAALAPADLLALSLPPLPAAANAVLTPASPSAAANSYAYSCVAGTAGPQQTWTRSSVDRSWVSTGGTTACAVCPGGTWAAAGATACTPCVAGAFNMSTGNTNVGICLLPTQTMTASPTTTVTATPTSSLTPTPTPTTSPTTSATPTPSLSKGASASVTPAVSPSISQSATPTPTPTPTPSPTPTPTASSTLSASATASLSFGASPSITPSNSPPNSASASPTPTPTSTGTPTPSTTASATPTPSMTASITASASTTPSPTPSVTPVPDVVLVVSFALTPGAGFTITIADVLAPTVMQRITLNFASVLGVPASTVRVANITDTATGEVHTLPGSGGRRLGAVAGSQGVTVQVAANLGKAPTQAAVVGMLASLTGANNSASLSQIATTLASSKGVPLSAIVAKPGPQPIVANAPFSLPGPAVAASSSSSSSSSSGAAIGGGVAGGILAVLLVAWMAHSQSKYGALPCCRDYERERREKLAREQALREAEEMRKELQAINPIASQGGGAMVIRNLQQSSRKLQEKEEEIARIRAEQDEQMARFKAQVAATVQREASLSGASLAATAKAPAKRSDFAPRTAV